MAVKPLPGVDPVEAFNQVFEDAYLRVPIRPITTTVKGHNTKGTSEPHFVRELISFDTIDELNKASSAVYGTTGDQVVFRGGFLHGDPIASYSVHDPSDPLRTADRELGDALVVLYETSPGRAGHRVTRRSAFMLMFKTSTAKTPGTRRIKSPISKSSDAEQFYLYNLWPSFTLAGKSSKTGVFSFDLKPVQQWCIGKFAVVWNDQSQRSKWVYTSRAGTTLPVSWLYNNPNHRQRMNASNDSFGHLLTRFIDGTHSVGQDFDPAPPSTSSLNGWNQLMGHLLGYKDKHRRLPIAGILSSEKWGNAVRDINPGCIEFMSYSGPHLEWWLEDLARLLDNEPALRASALHNPWEGMHNLHAAFTSSARTPTAVDSQAVADQGGMPVLFVYVNSRTFRDEVVQSEKLID